MRQALVTGASRGIGRAVTLALLADGWKVYGVSRTAPDFYRDSPYTNDVNDIRFVWESHDITYGFRPLFLAHGWLKHLDAVIHCAGIRGPHGPLAENDPATWLDTINTNLVGTYRVVHAVLPVLAPNGRILLMSGGGAFDPSPEFSAYAVAKAGVVSLMETLAVELEGSGITINCVAPGKIPTTIHPEPLPDDGGRAMAQAVACIRHLLSPATVGLTGKTVSAAYDDWESLLPHIVPALNASTMGTRARNPIQRVRELTRPTTGLLVI